MSDVPGRARPAGWLAVPSGTLLRWLLLLLLLLLMLLQLLTDSGRSLNAGLESHSSRAGRRSSLRGLQMRLAGWCLRLGR